MIYFINYSRIFLGVLFLFSGFIKAIDPLGLNFKLKEYFSESVLNIPFLLDFSLYIAILVIGIEIILGTMLLIGKKNKLLQFGLISLILFFTLLTFYSAYFNKVLDCGCFGEFLKLTPWQSFYKNIVFLLLALIVILNTKHFKNILFHHNSNYVVFLSFLSYLFIVYYGIFHLPIIDFTPYAEGKNIIEGMKTAKELGLPETQTKIYYTLENTKNKKEIKLSDKEYINNNWWKNEDWQINENKTIEEQITKGYEPPIKYFNINCNNLNITKSILKEEKAVLITYYNIDDFGLKSYTILRNLAEGLKKKKIKVFFISNKKINNKINCTMDETIIKTLNRANPGVTVLNKATIIKKYHWNDVENEAKIDELFK